MDGERHRRRTPRGTPHPPCRTSRSPVRSGGPPRVVAAWPDHSRDRVLATILPRRAPTRTRTGRRWSSRCRRPRCLGREGGTRWCATRPRCPGSRGDTARQLVRAEEGGLAHRGRLADPLLHQVVVADAAGPLGQQGQHHVAPVVVSETIVRREARRVPVEGDQEVLRRHQLVDGNGHGVVVDVVAGALVEVVTDARPVAQEVLHGDAIVDQRQVVAEDRAVVVSERVPSSTSDITARAVNPCCRWPARQVSGVLAMRQPRCAHPYAASTSTVPARARCAPPPEVFRSGELVQAPETSVAVGSVTAGGPSDRPGWAEPAGVDVEGRRSSSKSTWRISQPAARAPAAAASTSRRPMLAAGARRDHGVLQPGVHQTVPQDVHEPDEVPIPPGDHPAQAVGSGQLSPVPPPTRRTRGSRRPPRGAGSPRRS